MDIGSATVKFMSHVAPGLKESSCLNNNIAVLHCLHFEFTQVFHSTKCNDDSPKSIGNNETYHRLECVEEHAVQLLEYVLKSYCMDDEVFQKLDTDIKEHEVYSSSSNQSSAKLRQEVDALVAMNERNTIDPPFAGNQNSNENCTIIHVSPPST
ncbi:hypothetical protein BDA99DRAFT_566449 [Phascolomyces articulosus]|uniref:Uncharacterized protein n=1 Tax=Phascolomyces articulosus TaxID=60185 RepID=A0AAD5JKN6_9FUNG|nr:hypothetical protein BDA99DRAFT_566449 [Phascolomyces articulosus]